VFEIGFGMGDSLVDMAKAAPEKNFIGVEVHTPGVGRLLNRCESEAVTNLRVYQEDAIEVLDECIADASLAKVQIYFPDPWHKKKHNKRRIVQPDFIQKLRTKLQPGGVIHLATDWENYAEQMMEVMSAAEGFQNQAGEEQFSLKPDDRPVTKFEKRGQRLGHGVWDLLFVKTI
jgi:tRNA (guanine-N7-)-methyltransferase